MFQIFGICLAQNLVSDIRAVKANWWPFAEGDSWQWPSWQRANYKSALFTHHWAGKLCPFNLTDIVCWLTLQNRLSIYVFFCSLFENKLLLEAIQMELNVRCHTEIKLSAISQLSLDRTLFSFALIKMITRLSFPLVNNVKRRVFSLTCGWLALEKRKNQPLRL